MAEILKWIVKIIVYSAIAYVILLGLIYLLQRYLIYFPKSGPISPAAWGLTQMRVVKLHTTDGLTLNAWYAPPKQEKRATIIYFHGNTGHMGIRHEFIRPYLQAGYGVLLVSYRGYSDNPGRPSEQGLYRDGRAAMRFVQAQGTKPRCVVLFGESLGSGVAVQIATEYPVGALVLQAPFTSLADVARTYYPFIPAHSLLRDRYHSLQKITRVSAPKLFVHGKKDWVVPFSLGYRLYKEALPPKQIKVYPDAGHNSLPILAPIVIKFIQHYQVCH